MAYQCFYDTWSVRVDLELHINNIDKYQAWLDNMYLGFFLLTMLLDKFFIHRFFKYLLEC